MTIAVPVTHNFSIFISFLTCFTDTSFFNCSLFPCFHLTDFCKNSSLLVNKKNCRINFSLGAPSMRCDFAATIGLEFLSEFSIKGVGAVLFSTGLVLA